MNAIAHSDQTRLPAVGLSVPCHSLLPEDDAPLLESGEIHRDKEKKSCSDDEVPQEVKEEHYLAECSTLDGKGKKQCVGKRKLR